MSTFEWRRSSQDRVEIAMAMFFRKSMPALPGRSWGQPSTCELWTERCDEQRRLSSEQFQRLGWWGLIDLLSFSETVQAYFTDGGQPVTDLEGCGPAEWVPTPASALCVEDGVTLLTRQTSVCYTCGYTDSDSGQFSRLFSRGDLLPWHCVAAAAASRAACGTGLD